MAPDPSPHPVHADESPEEATHGSGVRSQADPKFAPAFELAQRWKALSLAEGRSLIDPSQTVWTVEATSELRSAFAESEDTSDRSFEDKLKDQLKDASPAACLLMADLFAIHLLPTANIGGARKRELVDGVGASAPHPFSLPSDIGSALDLGMIGTGMGYLTNRFYLMSFMVRFACAWVLETPDAKTALLADPYAFKGFLSAVPQSRAASQRNALLLLLFPDTFEDAVNDEHKRRISDAFPSQRGESIDLDRQLAAIRAALTPEFGADFTWYDPAIRPRWDAHAVTGSTSFADDLAALFPDESERLRFAEAMATAIERAHAVNTRSWSVSRRAAGVSLNVANNRSLGAFAGDAGFIVHATSDDDARGLVAHLGINATPYRYHFPTDTHHLTLARKDLMKALDGARDQFHAAIVATAVRNTPHRASFDLEVMRVLSEMVGRELPVPAGLDELQPLTAADNGHAWLVRMKRDALSQVAVALAESVVQIYWKVDVEPGASLEQVKAALLSASPDLSPAELGNQAGQVHRFVTKMRVDDLVLLPDQGSVYVGVVEGPATFESSLGWSRQVRWFNTEAPLDRAELSSALQDRLRVPMTIVDASDLVGEVEAFVSGADRSRTQEVVLREVDPTIAGQWHLDREWVQEIVSMLQHKKQIILYGPPGTGKTHLALELANHLASGDGTVTIVQFHPSYAYEDFVEGFRPLVRSDGTMVYELKPGPLKEIARAAAANPADPHFLIIDEINRGNLAKIFGELYFLLEYRDRGLVLQYGSAGDDPFVLPRNLFVIGTMNTADRSIAMVDAAIRRRFYFVELNPLEEPVKGVLRSWLRGMGLSEYSADLLEALNELLSDRDGAIGPSYFMSDRIDDPGELERIWKHGIMPLLTEQYYGRRDVIETFGLEAVKRHLSKSASSGDKNPSVDVPTPS